MDEQNEATYGKPCDWNELKVQLNNVTLMHGPASVTLAQAEEAMLRYIGYLAECEERERVRLENERLKMEAADKADAGAGWTVRPSAQIWD